jgi:uncharacterized membrane protein YkoI
MTKIFILLSIFFLTSPVVSASELSKKQIAMQAMKQQQGKIVSINRSKTDAKVFHVKMLTKKGRVRLIKVDGKTGRVIKD